MSRRERRGDRVVHSRRKLDAADHAAMNLPPRYSDIQLSSFEDEDRAFLRRYIDRIHWMVERGCGLLLSGEQKTEAAALLAKAARAHRYTVYFTSVWELRENIRSYTSYDTDQSVLDRCRKVDFLILDALSDEDLSSKFFGRRDLDSLVFTRLSKCQPTVITTDIDPNAHRDFTRKVRDACLPHRLKGKNKGAAFADIAEFLKEGSA